MAPVVLIKRLAHGRASRKMNQNEQGLTDERSTFIAQG
jgi:hypothetical protein